MKLYVIRYTGPRNGKPKYAEVQATSVEAARERFLDETEGTYITGVFVEVDR